MKLKRYDGNPILAPRKDHPWESKVATNPGAWYDAESRQVFLLYRTAGEDIEHKIHFGLATCPLAELLDYLLSCPVKV
jgi:predicted GH43/DUF377 family glycosyl hydrolase